MSIAEWYRDQLTGYAAAQRWTVTEEPMADGRDCRLEMRQGALATPVILYHTGKIVVRGRAHVLREPSPFGNERPRVIPLRGLPKGRRAP